MKFKETLELHEKLIEALGDDLVYSVAYDKGKYYLVISVHNSETWEYEHGGNMQTCHIDDFNDDVEALVKKVVSLYEPILIRKDNNENEAERIEGDEI